MSATSSELMIIMQSASIELKSFLKLPIPSIKVGIICDTRMPVLFPFRRSLPTFGRKSGTAAKMRKRSVGRLVLMIQASRAPMYAESGSIPISRSPQAKASPKGESFTSKTVGSISPISSETIPNNRFLYRSSVFLAAPVMISSIIPCNASISSTQPVIFAEITAIVL